MCLFGAVGAFKAGGPWATVRSWLAPPPPPQQQQLHAPKPEAAAAPVHAETLILGAGVAGLSCATYLQRLAPGNEVLVIEASDAAGGRVRTDVHPTEGYLLDRGFQVFIEEYPEARRLLGQEGYEALGIRPFCAGAKVFKDGALHTVSDPLRAPQDLLASLVSPIGSLEDKIRVGLYSLKSRFGPDFDWAEERQGEGEGEREGERKGEEAATSKFLSSALSLSSSIVDSFFTPFYKGIFLAPLEDQSSRMFEFVFQMFARGSASLCDNGLGMGAVGAQLARGLPVRYNSRAVEIRPGTGTGTGTGAGAGWSVVLQGGDMLTCNNLVVATDPEQFVQLLAGAAMQQQQQQVAAQIPPARGSVCLYYGIDSAEDRPFPVPAENRAALVLNGDFDEQRRCHVNNVCFPSDVAPSYAPPGKHLASVTLVGSENLDLHELVLDHAVRTQLGQWWGADKVQRWKLLRIYRIPYAQPAQTPLPLVASKPVRLLGRGGVGAGTGSLYVCGDHRDTPTLNGAIKSGRLVAEDIAAAAAR